ncbi:MAG: SCO family protein [Chitinophagaceae bacterium]|nr:MAG: SCO family protein [Chitinophagaceae bacterium]
MKHKGNKVTIFLITFFILLSAAFMTYYYNTSKEHPKALRVLGEQGHKIRSFAFTDQEGRKITQEDVKGKIYVVDYFFTTCSGICPKMSANMKEVFTSFRGNKQVMILSHTVDPEKDSVTTLKEYSLKFDADPDQWLFLTGDKKELYDMARYSYLVTAADDTAQVDIESDFIHTDRFVLVDGKGQIRGQYEGTNKEEVKNLIADIRELMKEK